MYAEEDEGQVRNRMVVLRRTNEVLKQRGGGNGMD